MFVMYILK